MAVYSRAREHYAPRRVESASSSCYDSICNPTFISNGRARMSEICDAVIESKDIADGLTIGASKPRLTQSMIYTATSAGPWPPRYGSPRM